VRVAVEGRSAFVAELRLTPREARVLRAGGLLNHLRG